MTESRVTYTIFISILVIFAIDYFFFGSRMLSLLGNTLIRATDSFIHAIVNFFT